jgi:dihydrofolate reductase
LRKVVVFTNLTLDGVMQAPGRPDEDRRGGFQCGGWAAPYAAMSAESTPGVAPLLMGRRTYYVLMIHPLVLGLGRSLFPEGSPYAALQLVDVKSTPTGVVIATYQPAQPAG